MLKRQCLLILIFSGCVFALNLVPNADFEVGTYTHSSGQTVPNEWDGNGGEYYYAQEGLNGYIVVGTSSSTWSVAHTMLPRIPLNELGVSAGDTVTFAADIKDLGAGIGRVSLKFEEYKDGGTTSNGTSSIEMSGVTDSWARFSNDWTIKEDTDSLTLTLVVLDTGGLYGFDNISLEEVIIPVINNPDYDTSGTVDLVDLSSLLSVWLQSSSEYNLIDSEFIDLEDFQVFTAAWLKTSPYPGYALVWADEFDGSSLNTLNWSYDLGNGCPDLCGWGNSELQYYRSQNVSVSDGNLVLEAKEENYAGYNYTSGKIHSRGKQDFLYGRIEARIKIPTGFGMWPAFWMMPTDSVYGGWAASGEIDIMESKNDTDYVGGALHFGGGWPNNASTSGSYSPGGVDFSDAFHVYSLEWEPDVMRWYVDGVHYMTRTSNQWYSNAAPDNPQAPFDQEFHILLNVAVGGHYTGCTDPACIGANFPQQMLIDWVRVYQKTSP